MKVTKTFSLEIEELKKLETWMKKENITNHSEALRELLKNAE